MDFEGSWSLVSKELDEIWHRLNFFTDINFLFVSRDIFKKVEDESGGLGISDQERVQIVQAMELTKGHWFKCPKGKTKYTYDINKLIRQSNEQVIMNNG